MSGNESQPQVLSSNRCSLARLAAVTAMVLALAVSLTAVRTSFAASSVIAAGPTTDQVYDRLKKWGDDALERWQSSVPRNGRTGLSSAWARRTAETATEKGTSIAQHLAWLFA